MKRLIALFVFALAVPAWAQRTNLYWTDSWPKGTPNPTTWALLKDASSVEGNMVKLGNAFVVFELHVRPGQAALYEVNRFIICEDGRPCDPETLVWLRPGGAKAQVFYRFQRRTWKKVWLGREWYWYPLPVGSPEYREELSRVYRLFALVPLLKGANRANARQLRF